jgi:hypothetical protein
MILVALVACGAVALLAVAFAVNRPARSVGRSSWRS